MSKPRQSVARSSECITLQFLMQRAAILLFLLALSVVPCHATTPCTTVTSTADDGSSGTLRFAVAQANSGGCDTIVFNLGSYPATITLTQNQLEISTTHPITITGPGALNLAISGNNATRVFLIDSGATVSVSGISINYGNSNGSPGGASGGGIAIVAAKVTIANTTFSGNFANYGGALNNAGGTLTVTGSTFSGNSVTAVGAGIVNNGTATITNTTFSGNLANYGGGMYNSQTAILSNDTFSGNQAQSIWNEGTVRIRNTILANSSEGTGAPFPIGNCVNSGTIISGGYNLSDSDSCSAFLTAPGDMNNTPPGLDPAGLKSNGGPTQTIAILTSSPAFNAIPLSPTNYCTEVSGTPVTFDQRGILRPQGLACDIGAFEYNNNDDDDSGYAGISGGNSFNGNQSVNGTVSATSFMGDGSGLTGVRAQTASVAYGLNCNGCVGNSQLGVSYALGDAQGGNAVNALALEGLPASAFAPASGSQSYAPAAGSANYIAKSGDTMTGPLNLPPDGLVAGGNQFVLTGGNVGIGTAIPESLPGYTSLHIDQPAAGFGGSFVELTHSATGAKGRLVMDDHGFLLESVNGEPVKIKSGNFINVADPGHIYITAAGNVGMGTANPAAKLEVNGTAQFDGPVTFAAGQTFPGSGGTITGVTAGTGLSGGGSSGTVALTNTGLLSLTAGTGINSTGGQTPTLSLNTTFSDTRYAQLGGTNTFTAPQTVTVSGAARAFSASGWIGFYGSGTNTGVSGIGTTGVVGTGTDTGVIGSSQGGTGVSGSGGSYGVVGQANSGGISTAGVLGIIQSGSGSAIQGTATSAFGTAGTFNVTNGAKILSGQNGSVEVFSVDSTGNVKTPASVTATTSLISNGSLFAGSVRIGGGTPITGHLSMTFNLSVPSLKSSTCTASTFTFTGASDGDTTAIGVPNALMSAGMIIYSAWVSAANTVTIRSCNMNPNGPASSAASGSIRVDIWKH